MDLGHNAPLSDDEVVRPKQGGSNVWQEFIIPQEEKDFDAHDLMQSFMGEARKLDKRKSDSEMAAMRDSINSLTGNVGRITSVMDTLVSKFQSLDMLFSNPAPAASQSSPQAVPQVTPSWAQPPVVTHQPTSSPDFSLPPPQMDNNSTRSAPLPPPSYPITMNVLAGASALPYPPSSLPAAAPYTQPAGHAPNMPVAGQSIPASLPAGIRPAASPHMAPPNQGTGQNAPPPTYPATPHVQPAEQMVTSSYNLPYRPPQPQQGQPYAAVSQPALPSTYPAWSNIGAGHERSLSSVPQHSSTGLPPSAWYGQAPVMSNPPPGQEALAGLPPGVTPPTETVVMGECVIPKDIAVSAIQGNYVNLGQFAMVPDPTQESDTLTFSNNKLTIKSKLTPKTLSTYDDWCTAFTNYEDLLCTYLPREMNVAHKLREYRRYIHGLQVSYLWPYVRTYDSRFRVKLSKTRSFNFDTDDFRIFGMIFTPEAVRTDIKRCFRCHAPDHQAQQCTFQEGPKVEKAEKTEKDRKRKESQVCFNFNLGKCKSARCPRKHICRYCKGPKPASTCECKGSGEKDM